MTPRIAQVILSVTILLSIAGVVICGRLNGPLLKGTSAEFWQHACGVNIIPSEDNWGYEIYQPRDDFFIYYDSGIDRQFLYAVPREEALADFPVVVQKVKTEEFETNKPRDIHWAAIALREQQSSPQLNPDKFLDSIHQQYLRNFKNNREFKSIYPYVISEEQEFDRRWPKIRRFWLNQVFEVAFFTGLVWFIIWPWLRKARTWRCLLHLALVPFLFFLPYFCGYCSWNFTSAGPCGGALYPITLMFFDKGHDWSPQDIWLFQHIPKFLGPLSQDPGPMMALSGGSGPGPVGLLVMGAAIAAFAAVIIYPMKALKNRRQAPKT